MAEKATEAKAEGKDVTLDVAEIPLPGGGTKLETDVENLLDQVTAPLFDDETVPTTEELKDTSVATPEKKDESVTSPPKGDEKDTKTDKEKEDEAKEEEKAEAEKKAAEEKAKEEGGEIPPEKKEGDDTKPPPGHVPYQALREERDKVKDFRDKVTNLEAEIEKLKTTSPGPKKKDEKEALNTLTERLEALKALKEGAVDNPVETIQQTIDAVVDGLNDLQKSIHDGNKTRDEKDQKTEEQRVFEGVVNDGFKKMATLVPGIFDSEKDVNKSLSKFAADNGLSNDFLETLTHPGTTILGPNGEPHFLGEDAAFFALFLQNASSLAEGGTDAALKDRDTKLEERITKEVTEKLLQKLKKGEIDSDFKSLGDLAGGTDKDTDEVFSADTLLSEAEFSKLSEADREKYLTA